jgi:hypothetical protein
MGVRPAGDGGGRLSKCRDKAGDAMAGGMGTVDVHNPRPHQPREHRRLPKEAVNHCHRRKTAMPLRSGHDKAAQTSSS